MARRFAFMARQQRARGGDSLLDDFDDEEAKLSSSSSSDEEQAQLSSRQASKYSWQCDDDSSDDENHPVLLRRGDDGYGDEDDSSDDESQASLQHPSDNENNSQSTQPPQIIKVNLSSDVQAINSILDDIKDPAIRAALESIVADPKDSKFCSYANEPDPSQHSWGPIDILHDGLLYVGFDMHRLQKNKMERTAEWFKSFYGVEHTTVAPYLRDLRKEHPDIDYRDCFMTLNWLCLYDTYPVLSPRWKRCVEYIGPKVIDYAKKMAKLAMKKIIFELEHDVELGRTVDCSTFMIYEMRLDPNTKWFDWKTHSAGLVSLASFVVVALLSPPEQAIVLKKYHVRLV